MAQANTDLGSQTQRSRSAIRCPIAARRRPTAPLANPVRLTNDQGGINGRRIEFISRDDGYSPPKTVDLVREMVEQEQVLLLFEPLGTAPNTAIQAYMNDSKVPQLFVSSGADKWNDPKNHPWTMG